MIDKLKVLAVIIGNVAFNSVIILMGHEFIVLGDPLSLLGLKVLNRLVHSVGENGVARHVIGEESIFVFVMRNGAGDGICGGFGGVVVTAVAAGEDLVDVVTERDFGLASQPVEFLLVVAPEEAISGARECQSCLARSNGGEERGPTLCADCVLLDAPLRRFWMEFVQVGYQEPTWPCDHGLAWILWQLGANRQCQDE